jgi:hypothetical protein
MIALLILVLALQTKPINEQHPRTPPNQDRTANKQQDSSQQNRILPPTYNVTNRNEQQNDAEKVDERRDRKKQLCMAVLGVLGAWVGLFLLMWQTILTRRSANAALLNAQAVISTDRPWIIVFVLRGKQSGALSFKASNEGRSPAIVLSCFAQWGFTANPDALVVPPKYGPQLANNVPLLMANVGHDLLGPFIDLYDYDFAAAVAQNPQILTDMSNGISHLVFWFKIVYTTQLAIEAKLPPYETRYCCEYSPALTTDLKIVGPAEYQKYS